jgi:peptide/nickel transport system substrate-binding protein
MMRLLRPTMVLPILAGLLLLGLPAAGQSPTPGEQSPSPGGFEARSGLVRFAIPGGENNLAPYAITFQSGKTEDLVIMVYDSLFSSSSELRPQPWVAESATKSEDSKTWTIKIRSGITWHDGKPLTPEDVKFTYEHFFKNQSGLYSHHVNDQPYVEKVELVGSDSVRFTCRSACATFDIDPGGHVPIIPKHVWENVAEPAKFTSELPVGSGAYKVVEFVPDQFYRLRANESYFKGKPLVDEIVMPVIKESATMFLALRSGQVDAVSRSVPPESLPELRRAGLEVVQMPDYSSVQIFINNQRPPLTLSKVRKALNLGTDTSRITETLLLGYGKPGVESFLSPDSPYVNPALEHVYDPERAKALLDESGIMDRNADGIRETADGKPMDFEMLVSSIESREVRAAELVGAQLKEIGVNIRVAPVDPVTLRARRQPKDSDKPTPERTTTGDFDMYIGSFISLFHFHADPDGLLYLFHCPGTTGFGASQSGYCNPKFDELVERASTLSAEDRRPLFAEAQQILFDDPPIISLYFPDGLFAYNPKAYEGWIQNPGHGIFNRDSFLPGKRAERAAPSEEAEGGGRSILPFVIGAIVVVVVLVVLVATKRRRRAGPPASGGPEVD